MSSDDETQTIATKPNASEREFEMELTNGAVALLRECLRQPGWAKKIKRARRAGKLVKRLPKLRPPQEGVEEWDAEPHTLTLGEADRDLSKECIRHFIEQGAIANTEHSLALIEELGISDD